MDPKISAIMGFQCIWLIPFHSWVTAIVLCPAETDVKENISKKNEFEFVHQMKFQAFNVWKIR